MTPSLDKHKSYGSVSKTQTPRSIKQIAILTESMVSYESTMVVVPIYVYDIGKIDQIPHGPGNKTRTETTVLSVLFLEK